MTVTYPAPAAQRAPGAKARILRTAFALFYDEGIRAVGIDRLIGESEVTKATFYKHFRSKDALIRDYIASRAEQERDALASIAREASSPSDALRRLGASLAGEISRPGFRGCPFINAAVEFPDPAHPVRLQIADHRGWYAEFIADLLRQHGHEMPGDAADEFMLARDGALSGGYASDPVASAAALSRAIERILA